jgi:hypothetical protein
VCERSERPDASSVKGNSYQTLFAFYALCVRSRRLQNMIREDRNNVEKTVTHMTTYTAEINLYNISVKRSEGVRAQRAPRRELCERQQLSNPVRFLCTLCTLIQTPEYDQRRPQQCREDRHKQKVSHYLFIFSSWSDTCSMIALRFPLCCLFSVVSQKKKVQSIAAATLP